MISKVIFREATVEDISPMQFIRNTVKENVLSDPSKVTYDDYLRFITEQGKGWVCEIDVKIVGFGIIDLKGNNIWALFLNQAFEKRGIGKQLQKLMLEWYFSQTNISVWLSTTHNTRAETFYRKTGWIATGTFNTDEIRFEMSFESWLNSYESK